MRSYLLGAVLMTSACTSAGERPVDSTVAVQRPLATTVATSAPLPARSSRNAPESAPPLAPELQAAADSSAATLPSAADAAKDPSAALRRYLVYSTFRGAPSFGGAGLGGCPPFVLGENEVDEGWEPDDYMGFVLPRLLEVSKNTEDSTGKSVTGRAELVRVAEIGRDSVGWVGRLAERVDTLDFSAELGADGWAVCGPATKRGSDEVVFVVSYPEALFMQTSSAHWLPVGTTWPGVAAHADSVLTARR